MPICTTPCKLPDFDSGRMVQEVSRRGVSGPTLIRLLARLTDADVSESRQPLSDRLSRWLGWTDAIALSTVLEGGPLAVTAGVKPLDSTEMREYERMRAALAYAIADEKAYTADVFIPTKRGAKPPVPGSALEAAMDYKIYRQRYQTIQQAMETNIAKLRGSLRSLLAGQTPERARLAMVDAIVERSLSLQERQLLAIIPALLEKHFKRLRQQAEDAANATQSRQAETVSEPASTKPASGEPDDQSAGPETQLEPSADRAETGHRSPSAASAESVTLPGTGASSAPHGEAPAAKAALPTRAVPLANTRFIATNRAAKPIAPALPLWLTTFRKDMRSVLLAELDIRLQPIEGLLAALRAS